ncbi:MULTISPECIES: septal junction protein FraD [unclassified Anabaena]|uniref:septal junction protein FraD n=1 Tax=unclassified Anabaena TaxID=2619674 RepID=UPI0039C61AE1
MVTIFKDLLKLFSFTAGLYEGIRKLIIPTKAYSWQTFIYLSIFSWALSSLAIGYVSNIIGFCGWLFLITGTAWYTTDDPLRVPGTFMPVGAVITGFLVSIFLFRDPERVMTSRSIVLWPTISALITAFPDFIEGGEKTKAKIPQPAIREKIIILVASCTLLSCWIQFYFVMDNWFTQYPSLLADSFNRSTIVWSMEEPEKIPKNGVLILEQLQPIIEKELANKPWSEVEKWLIDAQQQVGNLGREVINIHLAEFEEKALWRVEPRITNTQAGYRLDLLSIWSGPSSNPQGYYLQKSCRIDPIASSSNTIVTPTQAEIKNTVAEVECDRLSKLVAGAPPPQQ